jgi:hypothetical protein
MSEYSWSIRSALYQVRNGEPGTERVRSAAAFLERIIGSDPEPPRREIAAALLECVTALRASAGDVYTALRDIPGRKTAHIGVFSDEALARAGCQEDKDEDDEVSGQAKSPLNWAGDTAELPDGGSYTVIMTRLDIRTGLG